MRNADQKLAAKLLSSKAVRTRCGLILAAADRDETPHFRLVSEALAGAARFVAEVTRDQYPDGKVPPHSRFRHFDFGGVNRTELVPSADQKELGRILVETTIVSVLCDAGAGPTWGFVEGDKRYTRSEGLGVASFRAVQSGVFSKDPDNHWRVDANALSILNRGALAEAFQHVPAQNELLGITGRTELLRRLGQVAAYQPKFFGTPARIGNLFDYLSQTGSISAPEVLAVVLEALGPIWPNRLKLGGVPLGDCGQHPLIADGYLPFHKLSQWLSYSLVEALQRSGVEVTDLNGLTGLAEYRNGGLFLDKGVIVPRDPQLWQRQLDPWSEEVVEWRALTVALIDRIAPMVRAELGVTEADYPLAKILEGGTWAAGRRLAAKLRNGNPPLDIQSDGTLF
jgi:hypothetical protein